MMKKVPRVILPEHVDDETTQAVTPEPYHNISLISLLMFEVQYA